MGAAITTVGITDADTEIMIAHTMGAGMATMAADITATMIGASADTTGMTAEPVDTMAVIVATGTAATGAGAKDSVAAPTVAVNSAADTAIAGNAPRKRWGCTKNELAAIA